MNRWRRMLCKGLSALSLAGSGVACTQAQPNFPQAPAGRSWTPEELERMHRFRGVMGYEFFVSGFGSNSKEGVFARLFDDKGTPLDSGSFWDKGDSKSSHAIRPPGLMKSLNAKVYLSMDGPLLYDVVIPIADRIPDDLLDELRRERGNLRIKIRLHQEGVLLGWDIQRRPGFNRQKSNEGQHYPPAYSHTGGDFKEMRIAYYIDAKSPCQECVAFARTVKKSRNFVYEDDPNGYLSMPSADDLQNQLPAVLERNGYFLTPPIPGSRRQLREKGWYIHPKTGQKIETDF